MLKNSLNRKYKIYTLTNIDNLGIFTYLDNIFENLLVINPPISSQFNKSIIYMIANKNYFEVYRVNYDIFSNTNVKTLMVRDEIYDFLTIKNLTSQEIEIILHIYMLKYFNIEFSSVERCRYRYNLVEKEFNNTIKYF